MMVQTAQLLGLKGSKKHKGRFGVNKILYFKADLLFYVFLENLLVSILS